jgi:hypothetical protein
MNSKRKTSFTGSVEQPRPTAFFTEDIEFNGEKYLNLISQSIIIFGNSVVSVDWILAVYLFVPGFKF